MKFVDKEWAQIYHLLQYISNFLTKDMSSWHVKFTFVEHPSGVDVTLHNGASNEIKEIKVCKKCLKENPYCALIFDPIMFKPFFRWCIFAQIFCQMFFFDETVKYWVFFGIRLWKIMKSWSDKVETWHAETLDTVLKKARKQQFYPGSNS